MNIDREFIIRELKKNARNEQNQNIENDCGNPFGDNICSRNVYGNDVENAANGMFSRGGNIKNNECTRSGSRDRSDSRSGRKSGYTSRSGIFGVNAKYIGKDRSIEPEDDYLELEVLRAGIFYHEEFPVPIIFLRDSDKNVLPVFVGYFEYLFIKYMMERKSFPSATMYDVLLAIFSEFNILLEAVELEVEDGKLCCVLVTRSKFLSHFDISPGDGIALAYRTHTPIRMTKETLDVKFTDFFEVEEFEADFEI
ncbi:hypothetical protein MsAg5_15070 [Methanosarcinaceae archaeon Ag5]|uniref:BFN domain-containing protein n=1 Tax=Methanolapillus africanus TaxID=3028297 RepID=A0AAE4ML14_9EURY|nr:hypothetical protein [Methanosarcinaceae archaeon Ag5]